MKNNFFYIILFISFSTFFFTACAPSDSELQDMIITIIDNKDIMVDVTEGHVTLSGFIYNTKDTSGYAEKILAIEGINSIENNISYFNKEELESEK